MFEIPLWRFATSGTLILCYGIADHFARRRDGGPPSPRPPAWVRPLGFGSLLAFYLLIGPLGGALIGGFGNLAGIVLALCAMGLRLGRAVRYPDLAGRALFYVALPIAVGVPWGLVVLSLPAVWASVYCCRRAEDDPGVHPAGRREDVLRTRYRLLPGVW